MRPSVASCLLIAFQHRSPDFFRLLWSALLLFFVCLAVLTHHSRTALTWYDYVLTIADEIEWIWRQRPSPFVLLFYFNRYAVIFATFVLVIVKFPELGLSDKVRYFVFDSEPFSDGAVRGTFFFVCDRDGR